MNIFNGLYEINILRGHKLGIFIFGRTTVNFHLISPKYTDKIMDIPEKLTDIQIQEHKTSTSSLPKKRKFSDPTIFFPSQILFSFVT